MGGGNRTPNPNDASASYIKDTEDENDARCTARCTDKRHGETQSDANWQFVVDAWPDLPLALKAAVIALVRSFTDAGR